MYHLLLIHQTAPGITMVYRGHQGDNVNDLQKWPASCNDRTPLAMLRLGFSEMGFAPSVETHLFEGCRDAEADSITNVVDIIESGEELVDSETGMWSFEVDI